jgi:hypothetical protein
MNGFVCRPDVPQPACWSQHSDSREFCSQALLAAISLWLIRCGRPGFPRRVLRSGRICRWRE